MKLLLKSLAVMIPVVLLSYPSITYSESSQQLPLKQLSLKQLLAKAIKNQPTPDENSPDGSLSFRSSTWLATAPSLGITHLKGQGELAADETELRLNLPINSNFQRKINQQLLTLEQKIKDQQSIKQTLFLSGLIREALWNHQLTQAKQDFLYKKQRTLEKLAKNSKQLILAGESSEYNLLLIEKEINNTEIELLDNLQQFDQWLFQYQKVTGQDVIPVDISEKELTEEVWNINNHPNLELQNLYWQQAKLMMKMNTSEATPWNLSLTAKSTEQLNISDDQIGISVELPLTFVDANSQAITNEWNQQRRAFDINLQNSRLELQKQKNQQLKNRALLLKKEKILRNSVNLSQAIMSQIDQLKAQNEIGQAVILRQVLDALETQYQFNITQLQLMQNNSMSRQAAGISL